MRTLIVLDHPYEGSFTRALVDAATAGLTAAGGEVDLIDLHADGFDPVMHAADLAAWRHGESVDPMVADYQQRLLAADRLVLAFPIWWELMPAMTKGFLDKVLVKGVAYDQPKPNGLMKPRLTKLTGVTLITVMSTPDILYRVVFGNPITKAVFRGTFRKIGVRHLSWRNHTNPAARTPAQRTAILARTTATFQKTAS
ncbi:MAG: NAD(P)H-dependent oxidoreductase [Micrococcales bacterium]|nr:NAD(P)H-dependent oxidoreductase [Micrococcales bacterium]MCL2668756.1 NAD(P)H-dependent oxidoreductase [Micrococcales bacterium]